MISSPTSKVREKGHAPQQVGVTERKNRHILEVACAMLYEKHMLNFYWADTTSTTIYLMNRCTTNGEHELTPYGLRCIRRRCDDVGSQNNTRYISTNNHRGIRKVHNKIYFPT